MSVLFLRLLQVAVLLGSLLPAVALPAPRVAVSIAPLHSLVAAVMEGVAEPELIYESSQSPHGSALAPEQLKILVRTDLLIWVGPELETGLSRLIARMPDNASQLRWHDYDADMAVYERRDSLFAGVAASPDHGHDHGDLDPHFWLSPANARAFVHAVAGQLADLDPDQAPRYRANAERLDSELVALERDIEQQVAPVRDKAFILFHDGFQYYDRGFGLNALGALLLNPEVPPGPRTVARLKEAAETRSGICLFHEPQYSDRWLQSLVQGLPEARVASLDPLGVSSEPGPGLYRDMMTRLTRNLVHCLEQLP